MEEFHGILRKLSTLTTNGKEEGEKEAVVVFFFSTENTVVSLGGKIQGATPQG